MSARTEADAVVVIVRHPDFSNDWEVWGGEVVVVDVDYGASDLNDPEEFGEWKENLLSDVDELRTLGFDEAAEHVESLIAEADAYEVRG